MDQLSCAESCASSGSLGVDDSTKVANPSASYCSSLGFEYLAETETCRFDDLTSCDAWDFYKGKCMKQKSYCEQSGNTLSSFRENTSTSVYEYALCTFNDGSVCAEEENFRNNCSKGQCTDWKVEQGGCVQ
jgi:putative hemolysin